MHCVIPPNSDFATDVFRNASSKVVLPWSTCPIIVTIGCRFINWDSFGRDLYKIKPYYIVHLIKMVKNCCVIKKDKKKFINFRKSN